MRRLTCSGARRSAMTASSRAVVPRRFAAVGHRGDERRANPRGPSAPSGPITSYTPPKQVLLGVGIGIEGPDSPEGANPCPDPPGMWLRPPVCEGRKKGHGHAGNRTPTPAPSPPPRLARRAPVRFSSPGAPTPTRDRPDVAPSAFRPASSKASGTPATHGDTVRGFLGSIHGVNSEVRHEL